MSFVTLTQPGQEVGHVLSADLLDLGPPGRGQGARVPLEVAPIGLQRVLC
jgi:hypothetical protein